MIPIVDHIQITVKDIRAAETFYDAFLPIMGYDIRQKEKGSVPAHDMDVIEYIHPTLTLAISSPRVAFRDQDVHRRRPGALHHLAFRAISNDEVDQLYLLVAQAGANSVQPPQYYPQHGEKYYALFFKDPDGIKYEIVHIG